jgi:hypothetical protein
MAKGRQWKGELAKPIRGPTAIEREHCVFVVVPENMNADEQATPEAMEIAIARSRVEKLPLLFEHYGIEDKSDYLSLSLALAFDHVPGFAVQGIPHKLSQGDYGAVVLLTRTGRPREWTDERFSELLTSVEEIKQKKNLKTEREALRLLSRRAPWKPPASHRGDTEQWIETLESRLQDAKHRRKNVAPGLSRLLETIEKIQQENSGNSEPV